MDLDTLKTQRDGSRWVTDPTHVQLRQASAYEIARWANTRQYIDGPNASDGEGDEDEGDEEAEFASDEEEVDEDIQVNEEPARVVTNTANTADVRADTGGVEAGAEPTSVGITHNDALKLAADIGAEAATVVTTLISDAPSSSAA